MSILEYVESIASESYLPDGEDMPQFKETPVLSQLSCTICTLVLDQPVSLVRNVASGSATMQHLVLHAHAAMNTSSTALPSDPHHRWSSHCFQVSYSTAEENVKSWYRQACIKKHLESNCENFYQPVMNSPSKITLRDVLSKPVTIPATPTERRVTEHLV